MSGLDVGYERARNSSFLEAFLTRFFSLDAVLEARLFFSFHNYRLFGEREDLLVAHLQPLVLETVVSSPRLKGLFRL